MSQTEQDFPTDRGAIRSTIATAIVRLHAEHFGRGPTRARVHLTDEFVLVVLEDLFTPVERTLAGAGREAEVRASRAAFADVLRERLVDVVELATGRRVRAFLPQVSTEPEIAVQVFLLEPLSLS